MSTVTAPPVPPRTLRNAGPADLIALLQLQDRQKLDVVAPLGSLRYNDGHIEVGGVDPVLTDDGFYEVTGLYRPTDTAETQIGSLLDIPGKYVRRMRNEHIGLLDMNVNQWARRAPENKKVMLRTLWGSDELHPGTTGIVRAVLSDRYGIRDNYDTVLAVLDGMRGAGLAAEHIAGCDVTDDRLYLRVAAPEIYVNAPELLKNYRDPRSGRTSADVGDVVFAGLRVENSETGGGAFKITPELTVLACRNGMTMNKDTMRKVHLGARLDEGAIVWSDATRRAANELTKQQVVDAVASFMTTDYLQAKVDELTHVAGVELTAPEKTIEIVARQLSYTDAEKDAILSAFIRGGQLTAGGVGQAVSFAAQDIDDVTRSYDLSGSAVQAMELAAATR